MALTSRLPSYPNDFPAFVVDFRQNFRALHLPDPPSLLNPCILYLCHISYSIFPLYYRVYLTLLKLTDTAGCFTHLLIHT